LSAGILYPLLTKKSVIEERLGKMTRREPIAPVSDKESRFREFVRDVGNKISVAPREKSRYTQLLQSAGFKKQSLSIFMGSKILLAVVLPVAYMVLYALPKGVVMSTDALLISIGLAICGFLAPSYWLTYKANQRKIEIFHTLPDVLDLVTVCVEAGLSMDAALIKTWENPAFQNDPLAIEIKTASLEARAGKPRIEALKDMADRTGVDDVKSFVTMLGQTEKFGTSLSQALRVHADSLRTKRKQIAEEAAAKTSIKMLFPLAFFIFPALLVVILGPAFLKIADLFKTL
jgi:tight adherence protein C